MAAALSPRLRAVLDALPLRPGLRLLEIGCGPGALARAAAARIEGGHVLGIDRSARAIALATALAPEDGGLAFRCVAVEDFALLPDEAPFDLAVAVRVGALDGRHPEVGRAAWARIAAALTPGGRLLTDGGAPLRKVGLR